MADVDPTGEIVNNPYDVWQLDLNNFDIFILNFILYFRYAFFFLKKENIPPSHVQAGNSGFG